MAREGDRDRDRRRATPSSSSSDSDGVRPTRARSRDRGRPAGRRDGDHGREESRERARGRDGRDGREIGRGGAGRMRDDRGQSPDRPPARDDGRHDDGGRGRHAAHPAPPPPLPPPPSPPEPEGDAPPPPRKDVPQFGLSGKLADETNRVQGVTLLFNEPAEARRPTERWRLYMFKNGSAVEDPLHVHRNSVYLFGRERKVADVPTDHPSCSKQHAVLQYREVMRPSPDGGEAKVVVPYLMDLGSTNGTFLNGDRLEAQRYYELREGDALRFGTSSREYVLLHEQSTTI